MSKVSNNFESLDRRGIEVKIMTLDKLHLSRRLADLWSIDRLCFSPDRWWSRDNYMMDLPGKWSISKVAVHKLSEKRCEAVGYAIASHYCGGQKAHIHRIAVHPSFRRLGIGSELVQSLCSEASQGRTTEVTIESLDSNVAANSFYENLGFERLRGKEITQYLADKRKPSLEGKEQGRLYSLRLMSFKH